MRRPHRGLNVSFKPRQLEKPLYAFRCDWFPLRHGGKLTPVQTATAKSQVLLGACERVEADAQQGRGGKIPDAWFLSARSRARSRSTSRTGSSRRTRAPRTRAQAEQRGDVGSETEHVSEFRQK
jgi:hypothetical protein